MRPPAWLTRRASCCTQRQNASNGQPLLFDCHRDHGQSSARGSEFSPCETWLRQPRRRVPWSSTTGKRASPRSRGIATTPPRQEGRGVGTLPETTELETEGKRRVREGVQEEGDETARTLALRSRRKTREVFARVGGRVVQVRSGGRPNEGCQRKAEDGGRGLSLTKARGMAQTRAATGFLSSDFGSKQLNCDVRLDVEPCCCGRSVDHHPCLLVSSVVTALPFGDVSRSSQFSSVLHSVLHQFSTSEHVQRSHFSCGFVRST